MEVEEHPISDADEETLILAISSITIEEADVLARILKEKGVSDQEDEDLGLMVLALRKDEETQGQLLGQVGRRIRQHIEMAVDSGNISLELLEIFSSAADTVIESQLGDEIEYQRHSQMDRLQDYEEDEGSNWAEQEQQDEENDLTQQSQKYFDSSDLIITRQFNKQRQAEQNQAKKSWCLQKLSFFLRQLILKVKDIPSMLDVFHQMLLKNPELQDKSQELLKEIGDLARNKIHFDELKMKVAEIIVKCSFS